MSCKLDDPQRNGWAVFSLGAGRSLKPEVFGNDQLTVASGLELLID